MVFSADQAVVKGNIALMSNFSQTERTGEQEQFRKWFKEHGYEQKFLPDGSFFEGNGELHYWNDMYFVGTGFRTSIDSCKHIESILGLKVIPLKLVDPYFYHLDTCLLPLDSETVFYYPEAFDIESQETLKNLVPHLLPFSKEDSDVFTANSVATGSTVICQKALPNFKKNVQERGFEIVEVDVSEFNKSGGGIHCLTNILATKS
jgi:N-dimethylarginine dimethylaminohydrolase